MTREPFWPWDEGYDDIPSDDYLESFAREQQAQANRERYTPRDPCPVCRHEFHGVTCTHASVGGLCVCPTAWGVAS